MSGRNDQAIIHTEELVRDYPSVAGLLRPPSRQSVTDWCEANVVLSSMDSSEPGPYRVARTPFAREIMEVYTDPRVRKITLLMSTQVCKTQVAKNLLAWTICNKPGPILYVLPDKDTAQNFSENRIMTMFDACPALAKHLTERPRDQKKLKYKLDNCLVNFAWAGSPSSLASMPVCYVFLDEVGKFPMSTRKEADPVSLAKQRVLTFNGRYKIITTSTPAVPDDLIMKEWERSIQHHYFVPCPHCGHMQQFKFHPNLKWPEAERDPERIQEERLAWYECEECEGRIEDRHKPTMLSGGEWRRNAEGNQESVTHLGYHLNAIYSPWLSFSDVAAEFLSARRDRHKLQNFRNSWLAEPFQERLTSLDSKQLHPMLAEATLERGTLPSECQLLTAGVDWHGPRKGFYWVLWAWGSDYRGWLVDYGQEFSYADLDAALLRDFFTPEGLIARPYVGVDSGWGEFTSEVYQFCQSRQPDYIPTKGQGTMQSPYREFVIDAKRHKLSRGFKGLHINTMYYKDTLARLLDPKLREREENQEANRIELCIGADEKFLRHHSAEHKVVKKGKEIWEPKYSGADNHLFDCSVISLTLAERAGLRNLEPYAVEAEMQAQKRTKQQSELLGANVSNSTVAAHAAGRRH